MITASVSRRTAPAASPRNNRRKPVPLDVPTKPVRPVAAFDAPVTDITSGQLLIDGTGATFRVMRQTDDGAWILINHRNKRSIVMDADGIRAVCATVSA